MQCSLEELVAEPVVEGCAAGFGEQLGQDAVVPVVAVGGVQQLQQSFVRRPLAAHRGDTDDAVFILEGIKRLRLLDPCALLVGQLHVWVVFRRPAIAEQAGDGDLQHRGIVRSGHEWSTLPSSQTTEPQG